MRRILILIVAVDSVSVRRVEDITEALWGTRVSSGTVSNLNRKVHAHIERWRNQAIEGDCAYVFLDGLEVDPIRCTTWQQE